MLASAETIDMLLCRNCYSVVHLLLSCSTGILRILSNLLELTYGRLRPIHLTNAGENSSEQQWSKCSADNNIYSQLFNI